MTVATTPRGYAEIDIDLDKILSLIAAAHRLMEAERLLDLSALDRRVREACDAAARLPAADARPLTVKLEAVLSRLDDLEAAMRDRFGDLPIMPRHSISTAAAAYADMLKHFP